MDEKDELTIRAAVRLIKTRMRHFVYARLSRGKEWQERMAAFEGAVEGEAEREWQRALTLWGDAANPCVRVGIESCVKRAIGEASDDTRTLLDDPSVPSLIDEYVEEFDFDLFLRPA